MEACRAAGGRLQAASGPPQAGGRPLGDRRLLRKPHVETQGDSAVVQTAPGTGGSVEGFPLASRAATALPCPELEQHPKAM